MKVELFDFWPDGYVGHIGSDGVDLGKKFLINLGLELRESSRSNVNIYSHFFKNTYSRRMKGAVQKIIKRNFADDINKRKILHGHETQFPKLDPRDLNIWYTSENLRPPLDQDFDIFLSHDLDKYDGRNIYLPFWATRMGATLGDAISTQCTFQIAREVEPRQGICAIISNPEPIRMAYINQLSKIFPVDVYGSFGKPVTSKLETLAKYRVAICFENVESPGYVTEKVFDAWHAGCVPVWRGIDSAKTFNPAAIIDVTKLGFVDSIQRISQIMKSDEMTREITQQPLLFNQYDYKALIKKINEIISQR